MLDQAVATLLAVFLWLVRLNKVAHSTVALSKKGRWPFLDCDEKATLIQLHHYRQRTSLEWPTHVSHVGPEKLNAAATDQLASIVLRTGLAFEDDELETVYSPIQPSAGPYGEDNVSARVGSNDALDKIDEDFNRTEEAQATGFHGKNSELAWLKRLKTEVLHDTHEDGEGIDFRAFSQQHSSAPAALNEVTYHCDDLGISPPDPVDSLALPPRRIADALFNAYLESVHPVFPIIGKNTFSYQYLGFFNEGRNPASNWRAILNLIFAIAAKQAHLVNAPWKGDEHDHLVYFTRARELGLNTESILVHPNMQRVQVTGLMAFYLLAIHQINRSWTMSGIAARHAISLGLNLRNEAEGISDSSKEIRYRVWWALCSVERVLTVMTGRISSFSEPDCTVPAPLPLEETALFDEADPQAIESLRRWAIRDIDSTSNTPTPSTPSSSRSHKRRSPTKPRPPVSISPSKEQNPNITPCEALFFHYHTKLGVITGEALLRLYRASAVQDSWAKTLRKIKDLDGKMKKWVTKLPNVFDFTIAEQRDQSWVRQRVCLGLFYYSTIILANRPCMCRVDRHVPDESDEAKQNNRLNAMSCVDAATQMLRLLPDEPETIALYNLSPWWCIIHLLMQAATVLTLELSYHGELRPDKVEETFSALKKGWKWLCEMGKDDIAAYRAWRMCDEMLRKVAPRIGKEFDETPPVQAGSESNMALDGFIGQLDFPHGSHGYSGLVSGQLPGFSYDQYLTRDGLPTTTDQTEFVDMFPTAEEISAMRFGNDGTGVFFNSQSPPGDAGW
ncbi:MAG: hypothetical protein Q9217_001674 [Psora testacea]